MSSRKCDWLLLVACALGLIAARTAHASGCVWKVTGPEKHEIYLGGSIHALRRTDYPLPPAYNRAFEAASRIVFEDNPDVSRSTQQRFMKSAQYPKNDTLKNHLDPRTYVYLQRIFGALHVPEAVFSKLKPWAVLEFLWTPEIYGASQNLGIESYLTRRARANHKPVSGLESFREHSEIISGLSDHQAELAILLTLIPETEGEQRDKLMKAWRSGDVDAINAFDKEHFRNFPAFGERLIDARNRNWIPKIENDLQSGHIYFVVVGAGHFGGRNGLLALLRARGYTIEQL